ncbi:ATP-dependent helicase [Acetatifactor muris]|jgi:DNA helicase-2/ATP-dependent DNA helicase PcrA|uniref:ATP-dependent helicase n=1 Tax=Acetatifactor muris TaxID=879566 RepID=UPI0023EF9C13|nr:ATP-dependent helicase [Acetatifactor muris]
MDLTNANEAQKAAIMYLCGPCLVLAGPGSGKTYTITNRILYLLEQGIPPESILVITFMKEAALSMQSRFQEMASAAYPVNFGTFHSIFFHILRESHTLKSNQLLGHSEKSALLLPILKKYETSQEENSGEASRENENSLHDDAAKILSAISYYKNTMELSAAGEKVSGKWQPYFERICRDYGTAVKKTGRLDFDDMLYECKMLLQDNESVRMYWQSRFRHILIDEFQDINPVQYEAVKLLTAASCQIFAVGDDDQSIYGFRGSRPECLRRFSEEFQAKQFLLAVNYRSRHEIVQASLAVIGENKDRFEKQLQAAAKPQDLEYLTAQGSGEETGQSVTAGAGSLNGPVALYGFAERDEQYSHMIQSLSPWLQTGESCAVLFRTNAYMQSFAARLKSAALPYEMKERTESIYDHFIVQDIMAYLQIGYGQGKREHMLRVMNKPSRYISREALGEGEINFERIRAYYVRAPLPEAKKTHVTEELLRFERQFRSIGSFSLRPAISYILKAMGYEQYLKTLSGTDSDKWQDWLELLDWLKEDAAAYESLEEWQSFQRDYTKSLEENQEKAASGRQYPRGKETAASQCEMNPVQLLTVHGAKGLEFDRVWIPDCNEKIFPHGSMPDEKTVEEERRIFYVAMTRAKKCLELLYLTGTKERPRQPSRFLNPLFSHSSISSSNSQLSRYSSKASDTFSYSSSSAI